MKGVNSSGQDKEHDNGGLVLSREEGHWRHQQSSFQWHARVVAVPESVEGGIRGGELQTDIVTWGAPNRAGRHSGRGVKQMRCGAQI